MCNDTVSWRCRSSQTRCPPAARPPRKPSGWRCGYAFSYDEHCGRLVANSMQVFESSQSLDRQSATGIALPRYTTSAELSAVDVDAVWRSASDIDVDVPTSRWLEVLTEWPITNLPNPACSLSHGNLQTYAHGLSTVHCSAVWNVMVAVSMALKVSTVVWKEFMWFACMSALLAICWLCCLVLFVAGRSIDRLGTVNPFDLNTFYT